VKPISEFHFVEEWATDTPIDWWNAGRIQLNKVIRAFNEWQVEGCDIKEARKLRAKIILGMQTFGRRDGGSAWLDELTGMHAFVEAFLAVADTGN
jgi:hypothetical protein